MRSVAAAGLWAVGALLAVLEVVEYAEVGELGVVVAAGGATLHVRGFIAHLEQRATDAFEMGRDFQRGANVTSLY